MLAVRRFVDDRRTNGRAYQLGLVTESIILSVVTGKLWLSINILDVFEMVFAIGWARPWYRSFCCCWWWWRWRWWSRRSTVFIDGRGTSRVVWDVTARDDSRGGGCGTATLDGRSSSHCWQVHHVTAHTHILYRQVCQPDRRLRRQWSSLTTYRLTQQACSCEPAVAASACRQLNGTSAQSLCLGTLSHGTDGQTDGGGVTRKRPPKRGLLIKGFTFHNCKFFEQLPC